MSWQRIRRLLVVIIVAGAGVLSAPGCNQKTKKTEIKVKDPDSNETITIEREEHETDDD